jgi:uncharacterized membrane protein
MRFCANCRAQVFDSQCSKCGTGADERIPENPKYGFGFEGASLKENQAAALCYLGWVLTGTAFLFVKPYCRSRVVRFHAQQAILLTAAWMIVMLTVGVWVPLGMRAQSFSIMWLFGGVVHFSLVLLTAMGFDPTLPVLSMMARKNL